MLARWLAAGPKLLILDEPARAVDVVAKAEIYRLIDQLASQGMAIMVISSEMPELPALFGYRAGIAIHDRAPALRPTDFGLALARHWAR